MVVCEKKIYSTFGQKILTELKNEFLIDNHCITINEPFRIG